MTVCFEHEIVNDVAYEVKLRMNFDTENMFWPEATILDGIWVVAKSHTH